ncbi:MAG: hypothetical protein V9H26_00620 [Verrucomicrobiota bacterium]
MQTLVGQEAHFEIVDEQKGGWGNVGVGRITFTDKFEPPIPFEELPDLGTMGLALLGAPADIASGDAHRAIGEKLMGELGRKFTLAPGQSAVVTFVLTWHFPNLTIKGVREAGRFYATKVCRCCRRRQICSREFRAARQHHPFVARRVV